MTREISKIPAITSFAVPSDMDIAVFEALSEDEKRRLVAAEIEAGLAGRTRKVTADDIISAVTARVRQG